MSQKRCGIYLLTHKVNGKRYVGQSINIDKRFCDHEKGRSGSGVLFNAIKKHGWSAFETSLLELCDRDCLNACEQKWIAALGSMHPVGFNLTTGGQKYKFTDSARAHISERTRIALADPEIRARISAGVRRAQTPELRAMIRERAEAGRLAMTPEAHEKMRSAMRGVPKSEEWKANMRGRPKPEAWKAMMAERQKSNAANCARLTNLARNQSAETRAKIAASHRGMTYSDETRAKISASKLGKKTGPRAPFSAETCAKMSLSAKLRRAREKQEREASP